MDAGFMVFEEADRGAWIKRVHHSSDAGSNGQTARLEVALCSQKVGSASNNSAQDVMGACRDHSHICAAIHACEANICLVTHQVPDLDECVAIDVETGFIGGF